VKCPECGFDSFLETTRCKKCGHVFGINDDEEVSNLVSSPASDETSESEIVASTPLEDWPPAEPQPLPDKKFDESPIHTAPMVSAGLMLPDGVPAATGTPPAWKAELDERVATFRKRRSRTRGASDPNLEFDFEEQEPAQEAVPPSPETPLQEDAIAPSGLNADLEVPPLADAAPVEMGAVEFEPPTASQHRAELAEEFRPRDVRPVEFVLDPAPTRDSLESAPEPVEIQLAPMSHRMGAGLIDAAVLLFAAGVFALIFWRAGGKVSSHPLTLLVLLLVVVFQVLVYFGAFTAIIGTTPGLLWMGIEVRSLRGGPPTPRQAVWRAFGCLVSASALLLGYVWALFDSENLTWHDRMSETYLAPSETNAHHED